MKRPTSLDFCSHQPHSSLSVSHLGCTSASYPASLNPFCLVVYRAARVGFCTCEVPQPPEDNSRSLPSYCQRSCLRRPRPLPSLFLLLCPASHCSHTGFSSASQTDQLVPGLRATADLASGATLPWAQAVASSFSSCRSPLRCRLLSGTSVSTSLLQVPVPCAGPHSAALCGMTYQYLCLLICLSVFPFSCRLPDSRSCVRLA